MREPSVAQRPTNPEWSALYLGALALLIHGFSSAGKDHSPEWLERKAADLADLASKHLKERT